VRWGSLDELSLATNTVAVVSYAAGKLKVVLKQGCVTLRVGQDVDATIETPDGKVITAQTDGANRKTAQACYQQGGKSEFSPSCSGAAKVGGIVAGVAGAIAVVALVASNSRGSNPSPSAP
jgi:hypothetical protein